MTAINIALNNQSVVDDLVSCEIIHNAGDFCKAMRLEFETQYWWSQCDPTDNNNFGELIFKVIIGDDTFEFLCEERETVSKKDGLGFTVWGRSKQALLASPYSKTITDTDDTSHPWQTDNIQVSTLIAYVIANYCSYSVTVTWNASLENFIIYKDTFSASRQSPIEVISSMAQVIGAELVAQNDGSLLIEPYTVSEGSSTESFNDLDDIIQLSESIDYPSGDSAVTIYGYEDPSADTIASIETETISDSTTVLPGVDHLFKVYYYHSDGNKKPRIQFRDSYGIINADDELDIYLLSDDSLVEDLSVLNGDVYGIRELGTETITETVELYWGQGNKSKTPADGNMLVEGDVTLPFATQEVSYDVNYITFWIRSGAEQEHKAFLYFDDESANNVYTFTVTVSTADVCSGLTLEWKAGTPAPIGVSYANIGIAVYNPSGLELSDSYCNFGVTPTYDRTSTEVFTTVEVFFQNGEATLNYPVFSLTDISWHDTSVNPDIIWQKGSKVLRVNEFVDVDEHYYVTADITYTTEYDIYIVRVPGSGLWGENMQIWFAFGECDTVAISGILTITGVSGTTGDLTVRAISGNSRISTVAVYIDNVLKGWTDTTGELLIENIPIGDHTIKYVKSGYVVHTATITIYEGSQTN